MAPPLLTACGPARIFSRRARASRPTISRAAQSTTACTAPIHRATKSYRPTTPLLSHNGWRGLLTEIHSRLGGVRHSGPGQRGEFFEVPLERFAGMTQAYPAHDHAYAGR